MLQIQTLINALAKVDNPLFFFLGGLLEEVIAPIPSAAVMLAGGLSFSGNPHTLVFFVLFCLKVVLPIAVGVTLGSLVFYYIGMVFGHAFVEKYGRFVGVSTRDLDKVHKMLEQGYTDDILLLVARIFPLVPSVAICITAGVLNWPLRSYILLTFIGTFLRTLLLGVLAWNLGQYAKVWVEKFETLEAWFTAGLVLLIAMLLLRRAWRKKSRNE